MKNKRYIYTIYSEMEDELYEFTDIIDTAHNDNLDRMEMDSIFRIFCHSIDELNPIYQKFLNEAPLPEISLDILHILAKKNHPKTMLRLARYYFFGHNVEEDMDKGLRFYHRAAELGVHEAQVIIGGVYMYGYGQYKEDVSKAIEWWSKAVDHENSDAQYRLGVCYVEGIGVEKDIHHGHYLIIKSFEQKNENATYYLARSYFLGRGFKQNYDRCMELLNMNVKYSEHAPSARDLGIMIYLGLDRDRDIELAKDLWDIAVSLGDDDSKLYLSWIDAMDRMYQSVV